MPLKSCSCGFLRATRAHYTENLERMTDRQAKEEVNPLVKEQVYCYYTVVHSALYEKKKTSDNAVRNIKLRTAFFLFGSRIKECIFGEKGLILNIFSALLKQYAFGARL